LISFGRDILNNYHKATKKEWLITNGIGGYASSTVIGCNTRRYHGLLIASIKPPVARTVLVSKLDEVIRRREFFFLGTNKYPNTISPEGYMHVSEFSLDPFPKTVFTVDNITVTKEVFMVYGKNMTVVTYTIDSPDEEITFSFSPLIVCRDFHWLMRETMNFFTCVDRVGHELIMKPFGDMPGVHIHVEGMSFSSSGVWYKNMEYEKEQARGLNYQEDLFNPGRFSLRLKGTRRVTVILSDKSVNSVDVDKLRRREVSRIGKLCKTAKCRDLVEERLVTAADNFIVKKGARLKSIIAGYHWFSDWGRDAMIAMPGLLFCTGRYDDAKKVLTSFGGSIKRGLVANLFSDYKGDPQYNSMDASLWFIYTGYLYYKETKDKEFTYKKLLPWFEKIFKGYLSGTIYDIKADKDGLVMGGDETTQLTWMDVKIGEKVVTKRHGKPVEVNALWYNAIKVLEELTKDKKKKEEYAELAKKVKASFVKKFWNESKNCLYDVIRSDSDKDDSVRPNQIFAVSLKFSILDYDKEEAVFDKVMDELLTPFGLRSLSKEDKQYKGRCEGNQLERDSAYHQGTVWSWLMGPFIDAYIKLNGTGAAQKKSIRRMMKPLFKHLDDCGLNGVSEIFDGDGPHTARGCINQAWGVATLLRIKKMLAKQT
jgi:predicted glycogen debranching enzyme